MHLHFITEDNLARFVEKNKAEDIDRYRCFFKNSSWAWIVQTALLLRKAGFRISISNEYRPGFINIALANKLRQMPPRADIFVVSIDADQLRPRWANVSIVQNQKQAGNSAYWVPHWPQPGLVPRLSERKTFTHAAFFGINRHLYKGENWWTGICREHGIVFSVRSPDFWHDYSDVDIAIGVRSMTRKRYHEKPPTKLFNSWLAGVVFIGGMDSAYTQVGVPGQDYLIGKNEDNLRRHPEQLAMQPELGESLIRSGEKKALACGSRESTLQAWKQLLEDTIIPRYERWSRESDARKRIAVITGGYADAAVRGRNKLWRKVKALRAHF